MYKILLAEDDANFGMMLKSFLELHDFQVVWSVDGMLAYDEVKKSEFDICILDVMMPQKDGFALAEDIIKIRPGMPFIFLTAKSMKEDQVKGYKIGAADYLVKPFDPDILLLKLQAILKSTGHDQTEIQDVRRIGSFEFNNKKRTLKLEKKEFKLGPKENELLKLFAEKPGELLSREEALLRIWKEDSYFTAQSMNVFITKLRKYLREDPVYAIKIENVHGMGFILSIEEQK